jgi:tetratricopeptide (TPR) repeat protein
MVLAKKMTLGTSAIPAVFPRRPYDLGPTTACPAGTGVAWVARHVASGPDAGSRKEPAMTIAALESHAQRYQLSFAQVQMLLDCGRLGEALSQLERMIAADPGRAERHNDLAVLYHSAGRLADAEREIRRASELDPQNQEIADNRAAIARALDAARPAAPRDLGVVPTRPAAATSERELPMIPVITDLPRPTA